MNQLSDIIAFLQNIQSDLIGIIIPAIITATVAVISLFVNSLISIIEEKQKYNHEQFEYMQKVYPCLKIYFQQMKYKIALAKTYKNSYGSDISNALQKYLEFKLDEALYRTNNSQEMQEIDKFVQIIKEYIAEVNDLRLFFNNNKIPAMPSFHPILCNQLQKMLINLQYWSYLLPKVEETLINPSFINDELKKCNLDDKAFEKYINILDKWYQAY